MADLVSATVAFGVDAQVVSFDRLLVRGRAEARVAVLEDARSACERVVTPAALFVVPASRGATGVPVARVPVVRRLGSDDAAELIEDHLVALRGFVARLARDWPPDVIHAHTGLPDGIVAAQVGRELGIPVVVSEHASTIEVQLADPQALERYRTLLDPGAQLLAVSPPIARRLGDLLGVAADRIPVLPNPVDDASFTPADPTGRDRDELLWVGTLGEHKGIEVLLRTFVRLRARRPGLRLRLVGGERTAGDIAHWEALAREIGIANAVSFEGRVERPAVVSAMSRAGTFVHPSASETFGVVAAEAILSGLPVASRRSGGVPWIVDMSGGFGAVAGGDDEAAFAAAIEQVMDRRLGVTAEEARARLVGSVGSRAIAAQAISLYRDVARRQGSEGHPTSATRSEASPSLRAGDGIPGILVATERIESLRRVAMLPAGLREHLVLVVPPRPSRAADDTEPVVPTGIRLLEAAPVRHERPPKGRSPLARFRRATWTPPLTFDGELAAAVVRAVTEQRGGRGPQDVVAIDAPAAVIVSGIDARRVRLAPGSLRWLADRWDAERTDGR